MQNVLLPSETDNLHTLIGLRTARDGGEYGVVEQRVMFVMELAMGNRSRRSVTICQLPSEKLLRAGCSPETVL
jgi:hypothetical protein